MALINWNENLSVKIRTLDLQHNKLIDTLNKLHEAMTKGQSNKVLTDILNDLVNYTKIHFTSEEELFKKFRYPNMMVHKSQHDDFINKVSQFIQDFQNSKTGLSIELMNFLNKWLTEHILISDKAYSNFLNKNGIN